MFDQLFNSVRGLSRDVRTVQSNEQRMARACAALNREIFELKEKVRVLSDGQALIEDDLNRDIEQIADAVLDKMPVPRDGESPDLDTVVKAVLKCLKN